MHTTSHPVTGARTCKWQSVAVLIKVEVTWKRAVRLLELDEAFLWSNHTVRSLLRKVRTVMLWKCVSELIFEEAFLILVIKKKVNDVFCPAHTMPRGVSSLAYHQTSPGNMTQFSTAVIWGIDTMMSLWQHLEIKTNTDNAPGKP